MRRLRSAIPARLVVGVPVLFGSALLIGNAGRPVFTTQDKAYYADANSVAFIRPGLVLKILSVQIGAADGVVKVKFRVTDPKGLPLDRDGVFTPGPVSAAFAIARIPSGDRQFKSYTTRVFTGAMGAATNPWTDAGGTFEKTGDGEYVYTLNTKLPADFDRTVTHRLGAQASRDLTEFGMSRYADNDTYTFVPDGSPVKVVRDVVRTDTCNKRCHDPLALHGSTRRKTELCVMCHQPQNQDPEYGGTLNFPVLVHRIHSGADLPSVKAGKPLLIAGPNHDYSDVEFPAHVINCQVCHDPASGAAQADAWLTPNRAACGACHDDVDFATGEGHDSIAQTDDTQCATCHPADGREFDLSVRGAHTEPRFSNQLPGVEFSIVSVDDAAPGSHPKVTFTVKDRAGNPIRLSQMGRVALALAGPTSDYSQDTVEDVRATAEDLGGGTYRYTFNATIPGDATGTFSTGIEGTRTIKLHSDAQDKDINVTDAGINKVFYFSVDGSKVAPRRKVVDIDKCNACHLKLEMHGQNRNRTEHCVQCHNPNHTDIGRRPKDKMPAQTVNFRTMIHRIHTGENLKIEYTVYGFGGTPTDFTKVVFPGDRRNCSKCHVGTSYQLPLPDGLISALNPRGYINPMGPATSACMGCHTGKPAAAHIMGMSNSLGEACDVCHGKDAEFAVERVHAR